MTQLVLPADVEATPVSLALPETLSEANWCELGATIARIQDASLWWLGDWWRYGEHAYGDRAAFVAESDLGYAFQTCKDAGWVADSIETSRRRDVLSWSHHKEVAALEPAEQNEWLDKAIANGWTRNELRRQLRGPAALLPAPPGTFNVIYADPPWDYGSDQHTRVESSGGSASHYPTMSLADICAYQFQEKPLTAIVAESAVLFIWATSPLLPEALEVIGAWGFTYKASFVWDKVKHNVGYYNSVRHELLLVATRGSCVPETKTLIDSVQVIERSEHSTKPDHFYEIIETLYPSASKAELFARRQRDGWTPIGTEVAHAA